MAKQAAYSAKVQDPGGSGGHSATNNDERNNVNAVNSARLEARRKLEDYLEEKRLQAEIDGDLF